MAVSHRGEPNVVSHRLCLPSANTAGPDNTAPDGPSATPGITPPRGDRGAFREGILRDG